MARPRTSKEPLERLLLKISRMHFEAGQSKSEIARRFGMSAAHVGRLIREAQQRGIVRISITAPRFRELEVALIERYGLKEVRVVTHSESQDALRRDLGVQAAGFFEEAVFEGASVGVGSGRTLFEMVQTIREAARHISIFPLMAIIEGGLQIKSVNANTLVNILWFKSRPTARAFSLSLCLPDSSPQEIAGYVKDLRRRRSIDTFSKSLEDLDFYFFSAGHVGGDTELSALAELTGESFEAVCQMGVVGDYLFNTIDAQGNHVPWGIDQFLMSIPLPVLQKLARDPKRQCVLIAGGREKVDVIRAGLSSHLCNVLITDDVAAKSLV